MYLMFAISRLLKGFFAAAGGENVVVTLDQKSSDELQDGCVVVNDKNCLLIVLESERLFHRGLSVLGREMTGQCAKKDRARWRRTSLLSHLMKNAVQILISSAPHK